MTSAVTAQRGTFVAALTPQALREAARERARIGFTVGRNEPPVGIVRRMLGPHATKAR
jgi:hypothetical protein